MTDSTETPFRLLFAQTTARLVRRFGPRYWDAIEDAVQEALRQATTTWPREPPDSPERWLYRVAHRRLVDEIRRDAVAARAYSVVARHEQDETRALDPDRIRDDTLRMLFACCHPELPDSARVPLALKSVCGLGLSEIATAFHTPETTLRKRLERSKKKLVEIGFEATPSGDIFSPERIEAVRRVVYLILNEGYLSAVDAAPIREDLCGEAIRLSSLLCHDPRTNDGGNHALCALCLFHAARHQARIDDDGIPVRMADQDRSKWDPELIRVGRAHLARSAGHRPLTSYHFEAAIAAEHVMAPHFEATDWTTIERLYERLVRLRPGDAARLGQAIAIGYARTPEAGIEAIEKLAGDSPDAHFHAAKADLLTRAGHLDPARQSLRQARELARSDWQRTWIDRRLGEISGED